MDFYIAAALILIILVLVWYAYEYFRYGAYNTSNVTASTCAPGSVCESYHVHREHADSKAAADLMAEINKRNETFIAYLDQKYRGEKLRNFNPDHTNAIDVIGGTSMYSFGTAKDIANSYPKVSGREDIQERVMQLISNYNSDEIYEISPLNKQGLTSYTENKKVLILCLRRKAADLAGHHPLHDINTMMFVVLHELTHMMNSTWDHHYDFWQLFKFVLENAVEAGVYTPVDYSRAPIVYCGLRLSYNPLYDPRLDDGSAPRIS